MADRPAPVGSFKVWRADPSGALTLIAPAGTWMTADAVAKAASAMGAVTLVTAPSGETLSNYQAGDLIYGWAWGTSQFFPAGLTLVQ